MKSITNIEPKSPDVSVDIGSQGTLAEWRVSYPVGSQERTNNPGAHNQSYN